MWRGSHGLKRSTAERLNAVQKCANRAELEKCGKNVHHFSRSSLKNVAKFCQLRAWKRSAAERFTATAEDAAAEISELETKIGELCACITGCPPGRAILDRAPSAKIGGFSKCSNWSANPLPLSVNVC